MSDINNEAYEERIRNDILDELSELIPDFHDADTECIAESLLKHARKKYEYADKYICKEDMIELVMENGQWFDIRILLIYYIEIIRKENIWQK